MKLFTQVRLLAAGLLLSSFAIPVLAQVQLSGDAYLENPVYNLSGNVNRSYNGSVGCNFQAVGIPTGDTLYITALGFYSGTNGEYTGAGTVVNSHTLSLWGPSTTSGGNLSAHNVTNVTLSAGATVDANGFAWATLNPPLVLTNGDYYDLLTTVTSGSGNDAYLTPDDSGNNAAVVLTSGSPFSIVEGAYNNSGGFAYSYSTYLGPNMQYQIVGPNTTFSPQTETLYSTPGTISARDNYNGAVGCKFTVGATNVVVTHLGYISTNSLYGGLATSHNVAVFTGPAASPQILGQVVVPSGTSALYTNGFYWVQLNPPLLLSSNTSYFVAGQAGSGDGDTWGDASTVYWNPFFVGGTTASTNAPQQAYGPGTTVWPPTQFSPGGSNTTYVVEGMGYIESGPALAGVATTNAMFSSGGTISVLGFSSGQQPVTNAWWEAGSPNVLISTTTSPYAALTISNATAADDGTYFMTSSNALGGDQSSNVTVTVTAFPVTINLQPTNETVFQNYEATFSMMATGSPPISFQWSGNGTAISGATSTNYSLVATPTNNGEVFSCQASNNINNTPVTVQSSNVTLTVIPNLALPQEFLHGYNTNLSQNSFGGLVGGQFTVGNSPVTVTHLGYYAPPSQYTDATDCNLTTSHRVGIFNAAGTTLIGYVTVPSGTSPVINGYIWQPLQPALVLSNNTQYLLAAEVFTSSDPFWGNTYALPDLNPYFATSCDATYWGAAWPGGGVSGKFAGQMYSAPNLAILAPNIPTAYILPTNVTVYAGANAMLTAYVGGQPPVTVQWYTNGTALAGQTNLTLPLNNLTVAESSSNYYVVATGPGGSTQSGYGSVTVLPDSPTFAQNIQPLSQTAFNDQTVQYAVTAQGVPPLSYQWYFDGTAISGATNNILTVADVSSNSDGTYYVVVTNSYGSATSSSGSLTVEYPGAPGTYPSVVMGPNLLLYYPLNDFGSAATNWGALGFAYDGTYFGGCSAVAGPPQVNFGNNDNAVSLDGLSGCVILPPLTNSAGVPSVVVSNITIAAWVNDIYPNGLNQSANAAIFFQRSTYVFGLAVNPDPKTGADSLTYTWNSSQYGNFTGLDLPNNQWALATMVISPTNSAVYLQYSSTLLSTNYAASNPSATFAGNSYIGRDTAGSTRYWEGSIGDVMVFDQALSPTQINALYYGIVPTITLTISPVVNNQLTVTWSGGALLEATNVLGSWSAVPNVTGSSGSYTTKPSNNVEYYRVQQ